MRRILLVFLLAINVGWVREGPTGGTFFDFVFLNANSIIAGGGEWSASYLTNNNGRSWKKVSRDGIIRGFPATGYLVKFDSSDVSLSKDNGATWEKKSAIPGALILDLSVSNSNELYALVSDYTDVRFYLSNDLGNTWQNKSNITTSYDQYHTKIVVSNKKLYAVVGSRIFLSENAGSSWKKLGNTGLPCCPIVSSLGIDSHTEKTLYISTKVGIFKSTNGGNSWQKIRDGSFTSLAIHPTEKDTLYAVGSRQNYSAIPSAIKSTDGGKSFTTLRLRSRVFTEIGINPFLPNNIFIAAEDYGILKSENDSASWTATNNGVNSLNLYQLLLSPKGFVARGNSLMFFSSDGKKWLNTTGVQFNKAVYIVSNKNASLAQTCCPHKTLVSYNGLNWQTLHQGEPFAFIAVDAKKPRTSYIFSEYRGMKTEDSGHTWKSISIKDIKYLGLNYITALSTGVEADTLLVGTFNGTFYRSVDGGKSWKKSIPGGAEIYEITNDPNNSNVIYVGGIVGASSIEKRPVLFRTSDAGNKWETVSDPTPGGLRINPSNTSEIVAVNPVLLISRDAGKTWNNFTPELNPVDSIYDFVFDPKDPRKVHVSTSSGIFSTFH